MLGVSRNLTTAQNKNESLKWFTVGSILSGEFLNDQIINDQFSGKNSQLAISYDGNRIAVGAPGNRGTGTADTNDRGHVRIYQFDRLTQTWNQLGLDIDGTANNQHIGLSVAFNADGSRVAIGGSGVTTSGQKVPNGIVRVYRFDIATQAWVQVGSDIVGNAAPAGTDVGTYFGYSVALNALGNILVVGAPGWSNQTGRVQVFILNDAGTTWSARGSVTGAFTNSFFGASVTVDQTGNNIAVGVPWDAEFNNRLILLYNPDETTRNTKGKVEVYNYDGTNWNGAGTLYGADIPPKTQGFRTEQMYCNRLFGHSVSFDLAGTTLAVGCPRFHDVRSSNPNLMAGIGAVAIYTSTLGPGGAVNYSQSIPKIIYGLERDQQYDILPDDPDREFGSSVQLNHNGTALAVGHPDIRYVNSSGSDQSGIIQIYKLNNNQWVLDKTLENPRTTATERSRYFFGSSCGFSRTSDELAIHARTGNTILSSFTYRGFTHTYELTSKKYKKIDPNPPSFLLPFGSYYVRSNYNKSSYTAMTGTQWGNLPSSGTGVATVPDLENWYGYSVSMSDDGNIVAFGSPKLSGGVNPNRGRADIFAYRSNGTTIEWTAAGMIIPTTENNAQWGSNLCLSPDGKAIAIAGKYVGNDSVIVFRNTGTDTYNSQTGKFNDSWEQHGVSISATNSTNFGISMCLNTLYTSGTFVNANLVVGANLADTTGLTNCGVVRYYSLGNVGAPANTKWTLRQTLTGTATNAFFGQSIAMSKDGSTLIVGAPGDHTANRGRIYIYEWSLTSFMWVIDVEGYSVGNRGDNFGYSVDCNSDGTFIAVGAPNKTVTTAGIDSYSPGTVRVYKKYYMQAGSSVLIQLGPDIKGEEIGDCFGAKVSISEDGTMLMVQAEPKKANKSHYIQIYKYDKIKNIWKQILSQTSSVASFATKGVSTGPFTQNNSIKMARSGKRIVTGDYQNTFIRYNPISNSTVEQTNYGWGATHLLKTPEITTQNISLNPPDSEFIGPPLP